LLRNKHSIVNRNSSSSIIISLAGLEISQTMISTNNQLFRTQELEEVLGREIIL